MANPRKFSEKIALHTQKQAEETAAFEEIMREVMGATRLVSGTSHTLQQTSFFFSSSSSSLSSTWIARLRGQIFRLYLSPLLLHLLQYLANDFVDEAQTHTHTYCYQQPLSCQVPIGLYGSSSSSCTSLFNR